jgi:DNA (cytosine-5)-methyltransferase 1
MCSKIYIRTKFAWYILESPSPGYEPLFTPFYIQHRVLHLLVTMSLERPRITYDEFIDSLRMETDENFISYAFLGRGLTWNDVESDTVVCLKLFHLPV